MAKTNTPSAFVDIPKGFKVEVASNAGGPLVPIEPGGIFIHGRHSYTWLQYGGEGAEESYAKLIIPSDPEFIRSFAKKLEEYANIIEDRY